MLNHVKRSDTLFDNNVFFPNQGMYTGTNGDGEVSNPSRVNGFNNSLITNYISTNVSDENFKKSLINNYQNQKVVTNIYYIQLGYSIKF
jgi:hypothetical protein